MILIADSGSTKTEWCLVDGIGSNPEVKKTIRTNGINPYFLETPDIVKILKNELVPDLGSSSIEKIFYYGAGCSTPDRIAKVSNALKELFPFSETEVDHDLLAAARALCENDPGIAGILGTGSNSCLYDGKKITKHFPSLGFMLGDEGSGAYMGMELIRQVVMEELPFELRDKFYSQYQVEANKLVDNIYHSEMPSKYLASFSFYITENIDREEIQNIVTKSFHDFIRRQVSKYEGYQELKLNCVGTIGFIFSDYLKKAADEWSIETGRIIKAPMEGLLLYHCGTSVSYV